MDKSSTYLLGILERVFRKISQLFYLRAHGLDGTGPHSNILLNQFINLVETLNFCHQTIIWIHIKVISVEPQLHMQLHMGLSAALSNAATVPVVDAYFLQSIPFLPP